MLTGFFLREYRQRGFWNAVGTILLLSWAVSHFGATVALTESTETALSLASWMVRLLLVVFLVIWWTSSLARERTERFEQVLLSLPLSRLVLLRQRLLSWLIVASVLSVPAGALLWAMGAEATSTLQWMLSFMLELWLVAAVTLFVASVLTGVGSGVMSVLLFYLFMRMVAYAAALAQAQWTKSETLNETLSNVMQAMAHFFPSLHEYATAGMILHGVPWSLLGWQALQTALFLLVLLLAGGFDFGRKEVAT